MGRPLTRQNALTLTLSQKGEGIDGLFQPASVLLLETNLDDAPGLVLGYAQERLFALGALDVWHTPVQMKKNRPGAVLSALVPRAWSRPPWS